MTHSPSVGLLVVACMALSAWADPKLIVQEAAECRVFGRVVDSGGHPLAGVRVGLGSVSEPWTEGATASMFEVETGEDGRFLFEVDLPTASWVWLRASPSRFHAIFGRAFGEAGGRNRDPLRAGDNDLGTFTLGATGAVAGSVRSKTGGPLSGVQIYVDDTPGEYTLGAQSDVEGLFEIGHVPDGTYPMHASLEGYRSARVDGVEVRSGAVTKVGPIELVEAATLSGRVLDEDGQPLAGVRLRGSSKGGGRMAYASSRADGRFTMNLAEEGPHSFRIEHPGFEPIRSFPTTGPWYKPGSDQIEIRLVRAARTQFVVVDAQTSLPIERFGIAIDRVPEPNRSWSKPRLRVLDAPGGEVELSAEPGKHLYLVSADGYAPQEGEVVHEGAGPRQIIRLGHGATLLGRVTLAGQPVPYPTVRVERQPIVGDAWGWEAETGYDLSSFTGKLRLVQGDPQGHYRIGGLAPGTYRFEVSGEGGAPTRMDGVRLAERETRDHGEIELLPAARVDGRVVFGAGVVPAGLTVYLDDPFDESSTTVASDGTFAFDGLAPGEHTLTLGERPGLVAHPRPTSFVVDAGERVTVVLDAGAKAPCQVRVRITHSKGEPMSGLAVTWRREDGGGQRLGRTDARGEVWGECPGGEQLTFEVRSEVGMIVAREASDGPLPPGKPFTFEVALRTGRLVLLLPESAEVPERGQLDVHLRLRDEDGSQRHRTVHIATPGIPRVSTGAPWTDRCIDLGSIELGTYLITVKTTRVVGEKDASMRRFEPIASYWGEVTVSEGEAATVNLAPEKQGAIPR